MNCIDYPHTKPRRPDVVRSKGNYPLSGVTYIPDKHETAVALLDAAAAGVELPSYVFLPGVGERHESVYSVIYYFAADE